MGYYAGDFYAGARGDPGIGSFLGGLVKKAVGFIPGVGPLASTVVGGIAGAATKGRLVKTVGGVIMKHPVLSAAGAAGVIGAAGAVGAEKLIGMGGGGACPKGFHISKSKHSKRFGQCVRNRHMNACNPRALRRAIRRTHSFARLAMHAIHITHPKKKGRFGGFKKRRGKK